ncbi:MAG TPA: L-lactate dehydrogenase [Clostridiales bacterium]|jgi:L-lactate dehydrogenase|nr:L-lactate dehydrogenase [Clostridiales bacterium]
MEKGNKISILGAGNVGATIAYTLTVQGLASEIVLVDINKEKAEGEAMDIYQGTALCPPVDIFNGDYPDIKDSDIVIVTLGSARKPGQTRIDLAQGNINIIKSVMPQALKYAPNAKYVVVSNPVDIITYTILKTTGLPESQVFGSGTLLDTSRLRAAIAQNVGVSPKSVHAYVFGEHGDSSMIPWSLTSISGVPMDTYLSSMRVKNPNYQELDHAAILEDVHKSGGKVIKLKGATFYAIALSTCRICECILRNTNSVLTLSTMLHGEYGVSDVCVSLPALLGSDGLTNLMAPPMTNEEQEQFVASCNALKTVISSVNI